MAAAIPFAPMIIGAGAGAMLDKGNPMRGAMLGAVGGSVAGPAFAGLSSAGSAAAGAAGAAGAAPGAAASYGAALGSTVPGMIEAGAGQQAAMLAAQSGAFGGQGLAHTLGSFGVNPMIGKTTAMATMGPQGLFGAMSGKDMALSGARMLASTQQPQPQAPMMAPSPMAAPPPRQAAPPPQPMNLMSSRRMIRPQRRY